MRFDILTIFPDIFESYLSESLIKRALAKKIIRMVPHDLREFSRDRHRKVDDRPFGGGPGMVLQIEPIYRAVRHLRSKIKNKRSKTRVILFSLRGKKLTNQIAKRLAGYDRLILICGRYEGVDERVARHVADEEISIGDYVLSGGELPALVLLEAVARQLPGFLGKAESLEERKGSYPVYSRPAAFEPERKGAGGPWKVPKVLLSGDHAEIRKWRGRK